MLRNKKKLFAILLLLLAIGIISWFVLFEVGVRWVEKRLLEVTTDLREKGYTISYASVNITGDPLTIRAIFQAPHIKDPHGLFEWQGQEAQITVRPWSFYSFTCTFPGEQKISIPQNTPIPLGTLKVINAKGTFSLTSHEKIEDVSFSAEQILSFLETKQQPAYLMNPTLNIKALHDPLNLKLSFSTKVNDIEKVLNIDPINQDFTVSLETNLSGFQPQRPFPKSFSEWRDGGGVLEVTSLKLDWVNIHIEAEGTLTLDKEMYPLGSFSSRTAGYQEALDDMVKLGWIKKKNAQAASFILELFSSTDEEGNRKLTVPIKLQNKTFSVGPATLFKLQPVQDIAGE